MTIAADRLVPYLAPRYNAALQMEEIAKEIMAVWIASSTRLSSVGGTGDAITASANPTLNAYAADNKFTLIAAANNTGPAQIKIDDLAWRDLVDPDGAALDTDAIVSGRAYGLWDDGTDIRVMTGIIPPAEPTDSAMVLIQTQAPSAVSTVAFVNGVSGVAFDDTTYDRWVITIEDLKLSADDKDIHLEIGTGATPTWQTGAGAYKWSQNIVSSEEAPFSDRSASDTGIYLTDKASANYAVGSASGESFRCKIEFTNPEQVNFPKFMFDSTYDAANDRVLRCTGVGRYNTAAAITAVRLVAESGQTFSSGRVSLYGIKK